MPLSVSSSWGCDIFRLRAPALALVAAVTLWTAARSNNWYYFVRKNSWFMLEGNTVEIEMVLLSLKLGTFSALQDK